MEKFACNFDAIEIEAHNIIQQDNGQITYEPADFGPGVPPDVWSVFGHRTAQVGTPESRSMEGHGAGRTLIADCETPEAAEFIAELVVARIRRDLPWSLDPTAVFTIPIYWYTDRPENVTQEAK